MFISPSHAAAEQHAALVHRIGGSACLVPLPVEGPEGLLEVGELAGLPVWSLHAASRDGHAAGQRLARSGRLGLLLVADPTRLSCTAAVTLPPMRWVAVGKDAATSLSLHRLARTARHPRPTLLAQAIAFAEALDVDAAGRETFKLLRGLLDRGIELLPGSVARADRHGWTLVQLTRLLFLRFVESEGWLAGNREFLAQAIDHCLTTGRDPTRHLLHPLFFGTLNCPPATRSRGALRFGAIPFLNGGLFEPHAIERLHPMRLPVEFWREAFTALVDRVDVTLDADDGEGRVTPELLGRVFEGVMEPTERLREGAFFTPPDLVDAILRSALACHLSHRLQRRESELERALNDPDPHLSAALLDLTVLDPAVGSGAFLVGALAVLHGPGPRQPARIRRLVTRSLFGVDRHPDAVRLTELRLWLEVLRAMRGRSPRRVPPLPNLNASIRAGDSLLDPLAGRPFSGNGISALAALQRTLATARGTEKRALVREVRRLERNGILAAMVERETSIDREIKEVIASGRGNDLFGEPTRLQRASALALWQLRENRRTLRRERRRLLRDQSAPPFALTAAFAPAMARRGGFDLVVGNPPWVRAERLAETTRRALAARYRSWKSNGAGWRHLPDLSVAFLERSQELLAPDGTLALLLPAKIATADYAAAGRNALSAASTIHRVVDLAGDPRAGFDATTYPLALIASRRRPPSKHRVAFGFESDAEGEAQEQWCTQEQWLLAPPRLLQLAQRLFAAHRPLHEAHAIQLGLKTGANRAFLNPAESLAPWSRQALRGRDVRAFRATPRTRLLWPADARGIPWRALPAEVEKHLEPHRVALLRRSDLKDTTWWRFFRTTAATAPHRVAWGDLARRLEATMVRDPDVIPLNSCYVIAVPSAATACALTAWLNCSWIRALARLGAEPAAGGAFRFGARAVGAIPFPAAAATATRLRAIAIDAQSHPSQAELDDCTAELLGLDQADRDLLAPLAAHRR